DPDGCDNHADQAVARLDLSDALAREEPHHGQEQPVPHDEEAQPARERRELLVDEPGEAERRDRRTDDVDDVGSRHPARLDAVGRQGARLLDLRREIDDLFGEAHDQISVAAPEPDRDTMIPASAFTISVITNNVRPAAMSALMPNSLDSENFSAMSDAIEIPPVCRTCVSE